MEKIGRGEDPKAVLRRTKKKRVTRGTQFQAGEQKKGKRGLKKKREREKNPRTARDGGTGLEVWGRQEKTTKMPQIRKKSTVRKG